MIYKKTFLKFIMINTDKINQLVTLMPTNSRLPLTLKIHKLAFNENAIQLLLSNREVHRHITFIVIQPEQTYLLTNRLFQSVHCVIVLNIGVILSSACSAISEEILENIAKWYLLENLRMMFNFMRDTKFQKSFNICFFGVVCFVK
jgi:hypothetical protein